MVASDTGERRTILATVAVVLLAINLRLIFGSSSAVISDIRSAYHLGPASVALLTTGPVVCLGLFGPLALRALRRASLSVVLTGCLVLIGVGTAVRGVASWPALLGGTLAAGAGIAVANVLGPVFVRMFFPHNIGPMTGLFTALVSASAGLASGATVPVATALHGWRFALLSWALPTALAVLVFAALVAQHRHTDVEPASSGAKRPRVRRSTTAWAVTAFMGIQSLLAYSMIAWLPTIYRDRGVDAQSAGLVLTALSVASIATAVTVPIAAARMRDQRLLAVGVVVPSVAGLIGLLTSGSHAALLWAVLLGSGQGGQLSLALALINLRARDSTTVAGLSTMVQSIGYLIAASGPIVTGALHGATGSWTVPLLALIILMAPLALCAWRAGGDRVI
ncbi:MFS transporter [Tsukamurella sp. 8F]|uniref:CynX/NimT family MFS transporter n=1 Tax=unclassified Tsukamurella TaxID=2633480 RepID=UPI0023B9158E|nr:MULTISPECIES: MFS transporter [unclassified Tsukamurella]MDF0528951.1 MFS transporter [Tsukamurella sp. 8J]MDF0589155.1 MFS transporter [Tsukamurella sp. 8F]